MKKLLFVALAILLFQCQSETAMEEEIQVQKSIEGIGIITFPDSPLLEDPNFSSVFNQTIDHLRRQRGVITSGLITGELQSQNGLISFRNDTEFQNTYENVKLKDEEWQDLYDHNIADLLEVASRNREVTSQFEDEEDIENEIEDLLESYGFYDYDIQKSVTDDLGEGNLWTMVHDLEEQWLNNSGVELDMESDPTENYVDDEIMQVLLNEQSQLQIGTEMAVFDGENIVLGASKSQLNTRGSGGCTTWKSETKYGSSGSRRLKVKVKVRNYWTHKSLKAKIKGYKRRRGKWRTRRFSKTLYMYGDAIIHNANLQNKCDPAFRREIDLSESKRRRSYSIIRNWWGTGQYVGACKGRFHATGAVGSLNVTATLD